MKDYIPSYPLLMAIMFLGTAIIFYHLAVYGACWLFLIFSAIFLAVDCVCDAIKSDRKVYHINLTVSPAEKDSETE